MEKTRELNHSSLLKYFTFKENAVYPCKNGKEKPVAYLVMEFVAGIELYELIANSGAFNEQISRYYFK
jgi:serine/threonine protein kinase